MLQNSRFFFQKTLRLFRSTLKCLAFGLRGGQIVLQTVDFGGFFVQKEVQRTSVVRFVLDDRS